MSISRFSTTVEWQTQAFSHRLRMSSRCMNSTVQSVSATSSTEVRCEPVNVKNSPNILCSVSVSAIVRTPLISYLSILAVPESIIPIRSLSPEKETIRLPERKRFSSALRQVSIRQQSSLDTPLKRIFSVDNILSLRQIQVAIATAISIII